MDSKIKYVYSARKTQFKCITCDRQFINFCYVIIEAILVIAKFYYDKNYECVVMQLCEPIIECSFTQ